MKMKCLFCALASAFALMLTPGCGKDDGSASTVMTPEDTAVVFERSIARAKVLVDSKDFDQARDQIKMLEGMQLTPEQQKQVAALKARIPAQ